MVVRSPDMARKRRNTSASAWGSSDAVGLVEHDQAALCMNPLEMATPYPGRSRFRSIAQSLLILLYPCNFA